MSYTNKDWMRAVTKLVELTSRGGVTWELTTEYDEDQWTEVDQAFDGNHLENRYVIKSIRRKRYVDEEEWFWVNGFILEIYRFNISKNKFEKIATAPSLSIISNLFSAVEASYAYQKGALNGLLGEI